MWGIPQESRYISTGRCSPDRYKVEVTSASAACRSAWVIRLDIIPPGRIATDRGTNLNKAYYTTGHVMSRLSWVGFCPRILCLPVTRYPCAVCPLLTKTLTAHLRRERSRRTSLSGALTPPPVAPRRTRRRSP